jgi:hypothetical protein
LEQDFIKTGSTKEELPDIIDELVTNIPGAEITAIFYEDPNKEESSPTPEKSERHPSTSVIIHSTKNINLLEVLKDYFPEGNNRLAELKINASMQEAKKEIIELLEKKIEELAL